MKVFYGQLQHIIVVHLPAAQALHLDAPLTVLLADILTCKTDEITANRPMDMPVYRQYGHATVVDLTCVQCLVGRVKLTTVNNTAIWAILDRSGSLGVSSIAIDDDE